MWRYIFLAVSLMGFGLSGPDMIQKVLEFRQSQKTENVAHSQQISNGAVTKKSSYNPLAGRTVRAKMGRRGHFVFNTRMNDVPVRVLVDTGASSVAMNRTTARRLGIQLSNADFKYKSSTANGIARYAAATIDEIRIGRVIVNDVRAAVLKDSSLSETLLGMTFLKKLRKFEVRGDTLVLTQ